jgi:hypothetical protein
MPGQAETGQPLVFKRGQIQHCRRRFSAFVISMARLAMADVGQKAMQPPIGFSLFGHVLMAIFATANSDAAYRFMTQGAIPFKLGVRNETFQGNIPG